VLAWHLLTGGEDYAFARPSMVARKWRRLELAAGTQRRKSGPNGNPVWADGAQHRAERRVAEQAEAPYPAPGRRLAGERAEAGWRDTGARIFEAVSAASSAADLQAPAVRALARRSPAPTRTVAKEVGAGKSSLTFIRRTPSDGIARGSESKRRPVSRSRGLGEGTAAPMIVGLFQESMKESTTMAELERMTADEVVRHLLEEPDGADLVRESLSWLVQQLMEAEVSDQLVDAAGRDAAHVRLLDHRQERLLRAPARLKERREVAALPELRDAQLELPGASVPPPRPIAVAPGGAVLGAFPVRRADQLESLGLRVARSEVSRIHARLDEQVEASPSAP
jgi:hypothetical protein